MNKLLDGVASAAGLVGVLTCLVSGLMRLTASWHLAGISVGVVFQLGIGLMVFSCLVFVYWYTEKPDPTLSSADGWRRLLSAREKRC